ncbi:MAG: peroxiredoxin family protein [Candidatus Xenobiia bacterium LiM19]
MHRTAIFLILISAFIIAGCGNPREKAGPELSATPSVTDTSTATVTPEVTPKADAKDFSLKDLKGNTVTLAELKGKKVVLLVFWATWCSYCKEEVPSLISLSDSLKGRDFQILAVSIREKEKTVSAFIEKNKIPYTVIIDPDGKVAQDYGVIGVPTNIIIDKNGKIDYNANGLPPEPRDYIESLLAK